MRQRAGIFRTLEDAVKIISVSFTNYKFAARVATVLMNTHPGPQSIITKSW